MGPKEIWRNGAYDKDLGHWRQRPDRELTLRVRPSGEHKVMVLMIDGQEIYSCASQDVVFWAMRIAALLECDGQEQILRRLRAIDDMRPLGREMGDQVDQPDKLY